MAVNIAEARARIHFHRPICSLDHNLPKRRKVDDDSTLTTAIASDVMPPTPDRERHLMIDGETYYLSHRRCGPRPYEHGRIQVMVAIVQQARRFISRVGACNAIHAELLCVPLQSP